MDSGISRFLEIDIPVFSSPSFSAHIAQRRKSIRVVCRFVSHSGCRGVFKKITVASVNTSSIVVCTGRAVGNRGNNYEKRFDIYKCRCIAKKIKKKKKKNGYPKPRMNYTKKARSVASDETKRAFGPSSDAAGGY